MNINATDPTSNTTKTSLTDRYRSDGDNTSNFGNIIKSTFEQEQIEQKKLRVTERLQERDYMLKAAKSDPEEAEKLAFGYAHNSLAHALLDVSDRPNIRYSATGELVTPKTEAYFAKISQAMQERCTHLYNSEKNKGTTPVEILEKIFEFQDSMPLAFKNMLAL
jgi:hypothetical protein